MKPTPSLRLTTYRTTDIYYTISDPHLKIRSDGRLSQKEKQRLHRGMCLEVLDEYPLLRPLLRRHADTYGLRRRSLLIAHGDSDQHGWKFTDGQRRFPVQEWISQVDGSYARVILNCCNSANYPIQSQKSALLYPNNTTSPFAHETRQVDMNLYLPSTGLIPLAEHRLSIEDALKKELKKIEKNREQLLKTLSPEQLKEYDLL